MSLLLIGGVIMMTFTLLNIFVRGGHIESWDMKYIQGSTGSIIGYRFYASFDSGLGGDDYLQFIFPRNIGLSSVLSVNHYEKGTVMVKNSPVASYFAETGSLVSQHNFFFKMKTELSANEWYEIVIESIVTPAVTALYQDPIQCLSVSYPCLSAATCTPIVYDTNHAFSLLYDELPASLPVMTISVSFDTSNNYQTTPGASYTMFLDITPSVPDANGAIFHISIERTTANSFYGIGTDFKFRGACNSQAKTCSSTVSCTAIDQVTESSCEILKTFTQITFKYNEAVVAGKTFRIQVEVENPAYESQRDILVYSTGNSVGLSLERKNLALALITKPIGIQPSSLWYLWGIADGSTLLRDDMPYTLFRSGSNIHSLNSVKIGFSVDDVLQSSESQQFIVTVGFAQASDILSSSIQTNLPRSDSSSSQPDCYVSTSGTTRRVVCESVGPLSRDGYIYFVAAKVYFASSVSLSQTGFGAVSIVLKSAPTATLYTASTGVVVTLTANTEFLDTAGYHSSSFGIGSTQVISMSDDKSLSSTADGISNLLSASRKNTVGITPQVSDQQLIFLIKATEAQFSGIGTTNPSTDTYIFRMSLLSNPAVVKYETDSSTLGVDFAAFSKGSGSIPDKWAASALPCIVAGTCKNYYNSNAATYPRNVREVVAATSTSAAYNVLRFECQTSVFSNCANWKGYDNTQSNTSGVFSMRRVYFSSGFHSQIQADDQVLDFVIAFQRGLVTGSSTIEFSQVSAQLINAYTISASKLAYTKFNFVNFSDRSINPGNIIPTFLRISGLASSSENLGATAIAVFFDQNINLKSFYENYSSSGKQIDRSIGCSAGQCLLYDTTVINGKEAWMTNKMVLITQLKSKIESELNILIPVQNKFSTSVIFPRRLTIAFCSFTRLSNGLRNQLKVLSVYRAFGATTAGDITSSIQPINRMDLNLFTNTLAYSSESFEAELGYTAKYTLTAADVKPKSSASTLFQSDSGTTRFPSGTFDSTYTGAGITITSINYNVFKQSTLGFNTPPYGVASKCQTFNYLFNNDLSISACADFDKKRIYTVFCPVDNAFPAINTADGNIVWKVPYFDTSISANTKLSTIFHYAFSSSVGKIFSLTADPGVVASTNMNACTIYDQLGSSLVVSSTGIQTIVFGIAINGAISLDPSALSGYGFLRIEIAFTSSVSLITFVSTACATSSHASIFSCTYTSTSTSLIVQFTPLVQYSVAFLEQIIFSIPVKTTLLANPIASLKYTYSVKLPMSKGGIYRVYGNENTDPVDSYVLFAKCGSGNVIFVSSPYGKQITLADLKFEIANVGARSPFNFTLTLQNRDIYSAASYFKIDFGFIREGNSDQLTQNNFRCVMMESAIGSASTSSSMETYKTSWRWQSIVYDSNLQNVRIYPKAAFSNPNLIKFMVKCYGGMTPITGSASTEPLQVKWMENTDIIQETGVAFTYPTSPTIYPSDKKNSVMSLSSKMWSSSAFEAIYSFLLTPTSVDLSFYSKIYIEFPYYVSPGLSLEEQPECFIRYPSTSSTVGVASESTLAVCQVIGERRLAVWCNKVIPRGNSFNLDIFGVQQSSYLRMNTLSQLGKIFIAFDVDTLLSTGISEFNFVSDELPPMTSSGENLSPLTVLSVSQSSQQIRSTFDLSITFSADSLTAMGISMSFYARFPLSVSNMTTMGQSIQCTLTKSDLTTNLASSCSFLSPRNIIITRNNVDASQTSSTAFILLLTSLPTPNYVPEQIKNSMNVLLFNSITPSLTPGKRVGLIGVDYQAKSVSFVKNTALIDLCWKIFGFSREQDQNNSWVLSEWLESKQQALIYIGYYKKRIRLQPEPSSKNTEQTFAAAMSFTFDGDTSLLAFSPTTFNVAKGASNLQVLIAAKQTTPPGIHMLKVTSSGDNSKIYEKAPYLQVVVSGDQCQIKPKLTSYNIPVGGQSLPIELDFFNCMPVNDVVFTPLFSSTSDLSSDTNYQVNVVNQTTKTDGLMYFVIKNASGITSASATQYTMSFSISGTNGPSYAFPSTITLIFEDPSSSQYTPSPTASSIVQTSINAQSVVLQLECSQPGLLYWAQGPFNSLGGLQVDTVKSKLSGSATGFMSNATETTSSGAVIKYGAEIIYSTTVLNKQFTNLKVNTKYDFKYFCVNQMGLSSGIQSTSLTTKDDGSALLKLTFKFSSLITFEQQNSLACTIQSQFGLSTGRVKTDIATTCDAYPNYSNLQKSNLVVRQKTGDYYEYFFYIIPAEDQVTTNADSTNTEIREKISKSGFQSDFLLSAANLGGISALPTLEGVSPDDSIAQIADPQLGLTGQSFITQTISYQYLSLLNTSGFILVGLEEGTQTTSPSADQLKKGVNASGISNLVTFEVRVAPENSVEEFKFIQLKPGTKYTAYFIGSTDDPSSNAVVSSPQLISFSTNGEAYTQATTVNATRLQYTFMSLLLSFVLIFLCV